LAPLETVLDVGDVTRPQPAASRAVARAAQANPAVMRLLVMRSMSPPDSVPRPTPVRPQHTQDRQVLRFVSGSRRAVAEALHLRRAAAGGRHPAVRSRAGAVRGGRAAGTAARTRRAGGAPSRDRTRAAAPA